MLFRILKKDLKRRKGVNLILFLFITLATVFLASSINNILVVSSAVEYYMDYANVPDINLITSGEQEKEQISSWLDAQDDVDTYAYSKLLILPNKAIEVEKDGKRTKLSDKQSAQNIGTQDTGYDKVYDSEGNKITLKDGEIALSGTFMEANGLKTGEKLIFEFDGKEHEFKISRAMKDAAFGSDMIGMVRMIVNQEELDSLSGYMSSYGLFHIETDQPQDLSSAIENESFTTVINDITRDTYRLAYSFDMIIAALLILIGICLILIALLVLRFTLVFTIEEDYQEIGIMKAMGYREFFIKGLYLLKYFVLVTLGAAVGFALSLPVSKAMVNSVSKNMIMKQSSANIWSNCISALAVIVLVLLFCYFCTRKLNKISAIAAIRGGQNGERYNKRRGLWLHKRKRMPVTAFLGANDIASHVKRYLVLLITFCVSFILLTIPLNTLNTMRSGEMARKFLLNPDAAAYVSQLELPGEEKYDNIADLKDAAVRVENEMKEKDYDAELTAISIFFFKYAGVNKDSQANILTVQAAGGGDESWVYKEGAAPKLSNEAAFSEIVLKENDWHIGDKVTSEVAGKKREFIITGTYSDYMQLGKSCRLNSKIDLSKELMFDCWTIMVDMKTDLTQEENVQKLEKDFPDYEWTTAQGFVDQKVGGIQDSLSNMMIPMTAMLCGVIMLITLLMEKLFIVREKGEIAMMKSVGFRNSSIRLWQMMRMICVVLVSMVAAVPLSLLVNQSVIKSIFAMMGADVKIQVIPWQVYGVYPAILLIGILAATAFATRGVKKIHIRELNNLE